MTDEINNILNEIYEVIDTYMGIEDEMLKLLCLFTNCVCRKMDGDDVLAREYVMEKCGRVLNNVPIILDYRTKHIFAAAKAARDSIKRQKEND